jgi:tetratricopeptide (TPR) repeat protein
MLVVQWNRGNARTVMAVVAAVAAGDAVPANAQFGANRPSERVLFLVPRPAQPQDSAYAVQVADHVRERMEGRMRHKLQVIKTEQVCELLSQSGYSCDAILGPIDAARLARAFQADAYIIGELERNGPAPVVRYRMVDIGRSGLSGWQTVRGTAGDPPRQFAHVIVDSLDTKVRAAEKARECFDRRDRADYDNALRRAREAFEIYPNHPSAALCAAVIFEARNAPVDSQIAYYERAVRGDSLNEQAYERLSRLYIAAGDSTAALEASRRLLEMNPNDRDRRRGVIAGYITIDDYASARELADEWLEQHPDDLEFHVLKARACTQGEMWDCALAALAAQYERDSSLVGDTIFYGQIVGAAQEAGDNEAVLRWSAEAHGHSANPTPWLRAHVGALTEAGMTDSAAAIYDRLVAQDSSDVSTALTYAKLVIDGLTIDTLTPLDTARLFKAERLLDTAVRRSPADTAVRMNAAVNYYTPGVALAQTRQQPEVAMRLLEKALANDVLQRIQPNANFFLGFTLLFEAYALDQRVLEAKSCDLVRQQADIVRRGLEAMQKGRSLAPQNADQFIQRFQELSQNRIPELRRAFCQ